MFNTFQSYLGIKDLTNCFIKIIRFMYFTSLIYVVINGVFHLGVSLDSRTH